MTRQDAKDFMDKLSNLNENSIFHKAVIFYHDPLRNETVHRDVLSTDYYEVQRWAENVKEFYTQLNCSFAIYINGYHYTTFHGSGYVGLFTDEEEGKK